MTFLLAPMSPLILWLTVALLALPVVFLLFGLIGGPPAGFVLVPMAGLILVLYAVIWLWSRPTRFELTPDALILVWPVRRRRIERADIRGATVLAKGDARRQLGFGMRIGAGGLWGGFGWLWTTRRGLLDLYVSRETDVVLVELDPRAGRSLLLTPERPEAFVAALQRPGS